MSKELIEAIKAERGLSRDSKIWSRNSRQGLPADDRRGKHLLSRGLKAKFNPHSTPLSVISGKPTFNRGDPKSFDETISRRPANGIKKDPVMRKKAGANWYKKYKEGSAKALKAREVYRNSDEYKFSQARDVKVEEGKITSKLIRSVLESCGCDVTPKELPKDEVLLNYRKFLSGDGLRAISAKITKSSYGSVNTKIELSSKYGGEPRELFYSYSPDKESLAELDAIQIALAKVKRKLAKEVK